MPKTPLKLASDESAAKLTGKMHDIAIKEKETEAEKLAASLSVPYINLFRFPITAEAIGLIPEAEAQKKKVVCFLFTGSEIRLGALEPQKEEIQELLHVLEERHHSRGVVYLISENSLQEAVKFYSALPVIKPITKDVNITEQDLDRLGSSINSLLEFKKQLAALSNVTDLVTILVAAALKLEASDLHVESEEQGAVVRYRLDGILQEAGIISKELWSRVISRIKLLAGLKINIIDSPQDGRYTIVLKDTKIDVRVSTLPTVFGESVVMRILKSVSALSFEELGLQDNVLEVLKRQIARPSGMVITTGPTGSGKTTTLYAILQQLNKPGVKIITLEDPVEYKMPGINQSQIDASREYTFAKGLRSLLRQDPDIVMVGEIRDLETAETAIQAALTGHFMLSTIHTNNAAGAVPRFLSMGVKPFLLAPALNAVMGQRLVRRLCTVCKKEISLEEQTLKKVKEILQKLSGEFLNKYKINLEDLHFFGSSGCESCNGLGYKGRVGIYELLEMNKEIEALILKNDVSSYAMEEAAIKSGMVTMAQDGLLKALQGITSVEEVFRVVE